MYTFISSINIGQYLLGFILDAEDAGVGLRKLSWSLEANREDGCVLDLANTKQKHPNRGAELWGLEEEGVTLSWGQGRPARGLYFHPAWEYLPGSYSLFLIS